MKQERNPMDRQTNRPKEKDLIITEIRRPDHSWKEIPEFLQKNSQKYIQHNSIHIKEQECKNNHNLDLYEEDRQLKLEVKRLQRALCAEEASHEVTRITVQQLQNILQDDIPKISKKNSINLNITNEASSRPNRDQQKSNLEVQAKVFKDILFNIRSFAYPPISLHQHYKITSKLFWGMDGLIHLTYKTLIK